VVRERLTAERLGPYLSAADQDLGAAFGLYEWNIAAAASVLATIAMTEVVVRNAMDTELRRWAVARRGGRSWLDAAPLDTQGRDDVSAARRYAHRTNRTGGPVPHGKVVAELNLGFWRYLAASGTSPTFGYRPCTAPSPPDRPSTGAAGPRSRTDYNDC
jgi:hypothetical protein